MAGRRLPAALLARAAPPPKITHPSSTRGSLPLLAYGGRIHYLHLAADVEAACQRLLQFQLPVVGWDIEWTVTYQAGVPPRPVALIQLCWTGPCHAGPHPPPGCRGDRSAPDHTTCLLLHVSRAGLPPSLRRLLCSPSPLKVGVGAHGDALKIGRDFGLDMEGVLDLGSELSNQRLCCGGQAPQRWSLAELVQRLLGRGMDKGQMRCSNWEVSPLSREQVRAAVSYWFSPCQPPTFSSIRLCCWPPRFSSVSLHAMHAVHAVHALPQLLGTALELSWRGHMTCPGLPACPRMQVVYAATDAYASLLVYQVSGCQLVGKAIAWMHS